MPSVTFTGVDDPSDGTTAVQVDDKVLNLGAESPTDLTQKELDRVKALPGLKFNVGKSADAKQD